MSDVDAEAWLTQEVHDLLDQGPVGLYELIWGLRGTSFGLTDDEAIRLSRRVVDRIVRSGEAQIYAVQWPSMAIVEGPLELTTLDDPKNWSEGTSGPMMALIPTSASSPMSE
jgi:hypothetical protein